MRENLGQRVLLQNDDSEQSESMPDESQHRSFNRVENFYPPLPSEESKLSKSSEEQSNESPDDSCAQSRCKNSKNINDALSYEVNKISKSCLLQNLKENSLNPEGLPSNKQSFNKFPVPILHMRELTSNSLEGKLLEA